MAKVELKQPIVQAIADDVKDAASVVLVDYRGLTVAQDTELRKQLREAGIVYKVCKNTMMRRAFEGTEFEAIASIPSREELLSKLLGSLQSPITNLARVLNQIAEQGGAPAAEAVAEEAPAAEAPAAE